MSETPQCPNCERLQREVEALQQQTELLRRELEALREQVRRGKRQAAPFSRDTPLSHPRKPGRKPGEGPFSFRPRPAPEQVTATLFTPLERCPHCGGEVEGRPVQEHLQVDLPEVRAQVTRFQNECGYCPRCQRRVTSRHEEQLSTASGAAGVSLGPRLLSLAGELHHRLGLSFGKCADLFASAFGLSVTRGALCQASDRLADRAWPLYEALKQALTLCQSVHADETGWRINGLAAWLWVFTNEEITLYTVERSRGHEVILSVLGRQFAGVLHSDCFTAYDHQALSGWLKQKCFAHLLKELSAMQREKRGSAGRFARQVSALLRGALQLKEEAPSLPEEERARRLVTLEEELDRLIAPKRRFTDPDNARIARRLRKQRAHLFPFLTHEGAEATNNRAERALRPAVITRKTGGCSRSDRGAETHAIIASLLATARQQGRDALAYLQRVLLDPQPPLPFAQPP